MMDVLTGVASIAFSLCSIMIFLIHLCSIVIITWYQPTTFYQFTPNSPTTVFGLWGIICLGVYTVGCIMVGWYQMIITILHKWIKNITTQAEGYGCRTCQYIHHYTPLTSWLYLSGKLRMPRKIEDERSNIYVNCLWLAELEMNRERTSNMNELETSLSRCLFSRKSLFTNE